MDPTVHTSNPQNEQAQLDRYAIEMGVKEVPRRVPKRVRQRFNPLNWLASYIMRHHPNFHHVENPTHGNLLRDKLFFEAIAHHCDNERGRRELIRRRDEVSAEFEDLRRKKNGIVSINEMAERIAALDNAWCLEGLIYQAFISEDNLNENSSAHSDNRAISRALHQCKEEKNLKVDSKEAQYSNFDENALSINEMMSIWDRVVSGKMQSVLLPTWSHFEHGKEILQERDLLRKREEEKLDRIEREREQIKVERERKWNIFLDLIDAAMKNHEITRVLNFDPEAMRLAALREINQNEEEDEENVTGDAEDIGLIGRQIDLADGNMSVEAGDHIQIIRGLLTLWGFGSSDAIEGGWDNEDVSNVKEFQSQAGNGNLNPSGEVDRALLELLLSESHMEAMLDRWVSLTDPAEFM